MFGGDLNLRPEEDPATFAQLRERFGLAAATASDVIDHILVRGLDVVEPPRQLASERRQVSQAIHLSDHAPVAAVFAVA